MTRWSKSTRRGGGEAFREASLLSIAIFIVPPARCPSAHDAIVRFKRVKVAAAKRATQARTLRTRKPSPDTDVNESKNAEQAGEQEALKQGSGQLSSR